MELIDNGKSIHTIVDGRVHIHSGGRANVIRELYDTWKEKDIIETFHDKDVTTLETSFLKCGCEIDLASLDWEETRTMLRTHHCDKGPMPMPGMGSLLQTLHGRQWSLTHTFVVTPEAEDVLADSVCWTPCGCETEPDGRCDDHGVKSWALLLGVM